MSKWGMEDPETLEAINKIGFKGKILNIAAGDGRFNSYLLKFADNVLAIDISETDLKVLQTNCPKNFENKLKIQIVDITKTFPFENDEFDGIFFTGTLHLFNINIIKDIIKEIIRVLKPNGKIIIDFATDIIRLDKNGNKIIFNDEGNYNKEDSITFFKKVFKDFDLKIDIFKFEEKNLEADAGYQSITGNFLLISGIKN